MLQPEGLPSHYQWPPFPHHVRLLTALHVTLDGSVGSAGAGPHCCQYSPIRSDLCRYDPFCCV